MEEKKKDKSKIFLVISAIILVVVIIGATYAFFNALESTDVETITTGSLSMEIIEGNNISESGILPGDSYTKTFTVSNTGTLDTYYSLSFTDIVNTFATNEDLVYTLTGTNGGANISETIAPMTDVDITSYVFLKAGESQEYTFTLTYKETNKNQNIDMGHTFSGKFNIQTQDAPDLIISTPEELAAFALDVDNGNDYAGKVVAITNDIDLSSISTGENGFNSIGYYNPETGTYAQFNGTLDGCGHTLNNLYLIGTDTVGFIAQVGKQSTIKNIKLSNVDVKGTIYTGGLVGYFRGIAENCYVEGNVTISGENKSTSHGGLVFGGVFSNSSLKHIMSIGTVTGAKKFVGGITSNLAANTTAEYLYSNVNVLGSTGTGGLLGGMSEGAILRNSHANSIISNSTTDASVGYKQYGGVVGGATLNTKIENCFANTTINITPANGADYNNKIGGIVGACGGKIINSYANVNINSLGSNVLYYVGGIAGQLGENSYDSSAQLIKNCYSTGTINGNIIDAGGIVGYDTCKNSDLNTGNTFLHITNTYSLTDINAHNRAGGISGYTEQIVQNSFAVGDISITSTGTGAYAGSVIGQQAGTAQPSNVYSLDTQKLPEIDNLNTNRTVVDLNIISTSDWFKNTVLFDNSWKYEDGYYPLLYKLDENGNPTNQLLPGQQKIVVGEKSFE